MVISSFIGVTIIPFILRRHKNIFTGPFTIYGYIVKAFFSHFAQYTENMLVNVVYTDAYIWTLLCGQRLQPCQVNNNLNIKFIIISLYISTSKIYNFNYLAGIFFKLNLKLILQVLCHDLFYCSSNYDVEYRKRERVNRCDWSRLAESLRNLDWAHKLCKVPPEMLFHLPQELMHTNACRSLKNM